jgi:hypothetical protein
MAVAAVTLFAVALFIQVTLYWDILTFSLLGFD